MENRTYKQKVIRIKYNTYLRIRRVFPGLHNETVVSYFERLAKHLEKLKNVR